MAGITFSRDQIFRGWSEQETSRVAEGQFWRYEKETHVQESQKWVARHHTSETQEPYFYSVRTICPVDIAREAYRTKKRQQLGLIIIACVGVSVIVYLATRSYFENAWKVCQAIAETREFAIQKSRLYPIFIRYATAQDVWQMHPTAAASGMFFLRNTFCLFLPVIGWGAWAALYFEPNESRYCNLIIDRTKDERVPPSNFDIQKDCDPLTQEEISLQKLHSPQMIYLPNYVTEAKSFVTAVLTVGKKDFSDPVYRREFTVEEHKNILSQIERIFLVSEVTFNECFEKAKQEEYRLDLSDPSRYLKDTRIFNARGHLSTEAKQKLLEVFSEQVHVMNAEIAGYAVQIPNLLQREVFKRLAWLKVLVAIGYVKSLRKADKARWRIRFFENATGVTLRTPTAAK